MVVARPFNTYGPRQSARAVIPTIVTQALARDVVELGATDPTRDFLFVEDTVRGMMRCAEAEGVEGEVINLGTGIEISIGELAERVLRQLGKELPVALDQDRLRPADSEVERLVAGTAKAKRLLGWEPEVDLDEGLRRRSSGSRLSRRLQGVDLQRLTQRLDHRVGLLVGHSAVQGQCQQALSDRVGLRQRPAAASSGRR